ncbi:hypothetical protein P7K49_027904 [Saguinus oedipus]|uniref:Uncharacterized protein n=1 Tax=Saguinus oedipus TaxID=9490 RepID=A0ABQ9UAT1_SAGOE|nr:hypothetical protein P7K49_027904 [Saguinus oedipus]
MPLGSEKDGEGLEPKPRSPPDPPQGILYPSNGTPVTPHGEATTPLEGTCLSIHGSIPNYGLKHENIDAKLKHDLFGGYLSSYSLEYQAHRKLQTQLHLHNSTYPTDTQRVPGVQEITDTTRPAQLRIPRLTPSEHNSTCTTPHTPTDTQRVPGTQEITDTTPPAQLHIPRLTPSEYQAHRKLQTQLDLHNSTYPDRHPASTRHTGNYRHNSTCTTPHTPSDTQRVPGVQEITDTTRPLLQVSCGRCFSTSIYGSTQTELFPVLNSTRKCHFLKTKL